MSILKVFLHGQEIAKLELAQGQDYIIGRGTSCDIQLPNEKGISREHLKLFSNADVWTVELLSKHGTLLIDGESVRQITLDNSCRFSVPPFEIEFDQQNYIQAEPQEYENESPVIENRPYENVHSSGQDDDQVVADITAGGKPNFEATQAGVVSLVPYLRVQNTRTHEEFVLKLEGHVWTAGRHPSSEIHIDDSAVSRKHFEISRTEGGFQIIDLESSNGLKLNGQKIEPNSHYPIMSGDQITIRHVTLAFEIHDDKYQERLAQIKNLPNIDAPSDMDSAHDVEQLNYPQPVLQQVPGPGAVRVDAIKQKHGLQPKTLILGSVAAVLLLAALFSGGEKEDLPSSTPGQENQVKEPSKKELDEARHLFELAKNYYRTGNYEFCINQIDKLHQIMPSYENSKEIQTYCQQAIDLVKINEDRDRKERERHAVEQQIKQVIDSCQLNPQAKQSSQAMRECLQPALELSPDHAGAMSLIVELESKEEQARIKQAQQASSAEHQARGRRAYEAAKSAEASGQLTKALSKYKSFLQGNYNLNEQESNAKSAINKINQELNRRSQGYLKTCEVYFNKLLYRQAIEECGQVLKIDSNNARAREIQTTSHLKMKNELKKIYESSILEEGFGNVEAAKEKWREIIKNSVPESVYYKKAKSKLQKYGAM